MYKRLYLAVFMMLLLASSSFSASHEKNFEVFENSVIEVANNISWIGKHNFQDVEFIENEMEGDETVYARAWYDDYYLVIRAYTDKTWSKSYVMGFYTNSEELTFTDGIKVGSSIEDVKAFFGEERIFYSPSSKKYRVFREEESDTAGSIIFSTENDKITSIAYQDWYNMTSKMSFLFSLYADLAFAKVTGDKVNVREYSGYEMGKDKVLFQVNKSKGDCLLVYSEAEKGWRFVEGRITNNSYKSVLHTCYISEQFLRSRNLTIPERNLYFSQYLKNKK